MSNFDLNNPADFARATVSPAALLLFELTGISPDKWAIVESSFISNGTLARNPAAQPVKFLIFQNIGSYQAGLSNVTDAGGRQKVKFRFPYRDGQTTDDLGRKPEGFEFNCLLFGSNYQEGLKALLAECNQPTPGILLHPVRGKFPVAIEDYELIHTAETRQAVAVRIRFTEHTFTIQKLTEQAAGGLPSLKSALVAGLDAVKRINTVITQVTSTILAARQVANRISALLTTYNSDYVANLQRINKTFNTGSSSDLPSLLPVNEGGIAVGTGVSQETFPLASPLNDPFNGFPAPPDQALIQAVQTSQAVDQTNALRTQASAIIEELEAVTSFDLGEGSINFAQGGVAIGSIVFHDQILAIKETAITMQDVLETGIASSSFKIVEYTVPRVMSVREAAFLAGSNPDLSFQIELLNPFLLSANYIDAGTVLQVPVTR